MYDIERLKKQRTFKDKQYWGCPTNFEGGVNQEMAGKKVRIHDVTLRDGEQTSKLAFSQGDRVRVAQSLDELGVARIEAGMPVVSAENRAGIKEIVELGLNAEIVGFLRANKLDVDLAEECGLKTVIIEHCINPYLIEQAYGLEKKEVISRCIEASNYAKEKGMKTIFMGWDLTRCDDMDYIKDCYDQIFAECQPEAFVLVDTFGIAVPRAAGQLVRMVKEWLPETIIEYHNHNDYGLANAGVIEAVAAGAEVIHGSINGLGERAGNAATEEVIAMLEVLCEVDTGADLSKLMDVSILVENLTNRPVPPNKPVVGRTLFDVETGVGVDIIRKLGNKGFDMPISSIVPGLVGQPEGNLVLGKNSGRATIEFYLEKHGITANKEQVAQIVDIVKTEGRLQRALLSDVQFKGICERVL
jgi:isopropylmalate/homocitrate/citramalate synthase